MVEIVVNPTSSLTSMMSQIFLRVLLFVCLLSFYISSENLPETCLLFALFGPEIHIEITVCKKIFGMTLENQNVRFSKSKEWKNTDPSG